MNTVLKLILNLNNMKTIELKLYQFSELSDKAKEKALAKFSDINTDYEWWSYIVDDAKEIGFKLESFDIYRREITMKMIVSVPESIKLIKENHGESCETYKIALETEKELEEYKDDETMTEAVE
jgi:hypothetical protein